MLHVYDGSFVLQVPVAHNGTVRTKGPGGTQPVTVSGSVRWQACDDQACGLPQHQRFAFDVPAGRIVLPERGELRPPTSHP